MISVSGMIFRQVQAAPGLPGSCLTPEFRRGKSSISPGNFLRVTLRRTPRNSAVKHTPFVVKEGHDGAIILGSFEARFTAEISGKNDRISRSKCGVFRAKKPAFSD
jgi:hypothetical protein